MAIFNKTNAREISSNETTIVARGAKIDGVFNCSSRLHVDGVITGQIDSKNTVTIGKSGKISGEVVTTRLIVNGLFEGDANCDTIEILAGGKFIGKATSKELIIEAKAIFEGESKIKKDDKPLKLEQKEK